MSKKPNKWYHTQNWWNSEIVDSWENAVYIGCIEIVEEKKRSSERLLNPYSIRLWFLSYIGLFSFLPNSRIETLGISSRLKFAWHNMPPPQYD